MLQRVNEKKTSNCRKHLNSKLKVTTKHPKRESDETGHLISRWNIRLMYLI